mgnify:CR=1 FL=1
MRPNLSHELEKQSRRFCSCSADVAHRAASSAYSSSLTMTLWVRDLALNLDRLKKFPSSRDSMDTPVEDTRLLLVTLKTYEKYSPNSVGASTQPCFTPLLIGKLSDIAPLYWKQACIPAWKDWMRVSRVGGQPDFASTVIRDVLSTRSNALVRSRKAK